MTIKLQNQTLLAPGLEGQGFRMGEEQIVLNIFVRIQVIKKAREIDQIFSSENVAKPTESQTSEILISNKTQQIIVSSCLLFLIFHIFEINIFESYSIIFPEQFVLNNFTAFIFSFRVFRGYLEEREKQQRQLELASVNIISKVTLEWSFEWLPQGENTLISFSRID